MLGSQFVFHLPASSLSRASVAYAQVFGTPGKVQVRYRLAVADSPFRVSPPTVT